MRKEEAESRGQQLLADRELFLLAIKRLQARGYFYPMDVLHLEMPWLKYNQQKKSKHNA